MSIFSNVGLLSLFVAASTAVIRDERVHTCDRSPLNTTLGSYYVDVPGITVADIAKATNRGLCDIGRINCMADVTILPNIGQTIVIPTEICEPDNTSCLLPETPSTNKCIMGGPRLYYTMSGDTYGRVAQRLNITVGSLLNSNATAEDVLPVGQFIKVPLCNPSECVLQPFTFEYGVYKDLAEKFGSTVGQIMMLSPTYNYSGWSVTGNSAPTINLPINCTALSSGFTVIS